MDVGFGVWISCFLKRFTCNTKLYGRDIFKRCCKAEEN